MKLLIDLQALQNESRERGIGRYVKSLFDALTSRDDIEIYGLLNGAMESTFESAYTRITQKIDPTRVLVFPGIKDTCEHISENKHRRVIGEAAYEAFVSQAGCDAILVGSAVEGFGDDTCLSLRDPTANYLKSVVLYDLIPLFDPDKYLGCSKTKAWYANRILQLEAADLTLAISESSRNEALSLLGAQEQSSVSISTAIDTTLFNPNVPVSEKILATLAITKPFLMHTSAIEPRKNFDGLLRAFAKLPSDVRKNYQLLFVGNVSEGMEKYLRDIADLENIPQSDLIIPGFVADEDLAKLYRLCSLFVFPSFHEGFGLPALEAMACGCPTIGSNVTSIPEVIGDPSYTFDPQDPEDISNLILRLLTDNLAWKKAKEHALKHAATFSWDVIAERAVVALKERLAGRPSTRPAYPSAKRMAAHVAERVDLNGLPASDLEALARCLAAAETELITKLASSCETSSKTWRIEGPFDSTYSLALVNRETARAMAGLGWKMALHSTEGPGDFPANPDFLAANSDLAAMHDHAAEVSQERSFAVSRLLYPPRVADMAGQINALHHYAWEESGFPHTWVDDFNASLNMMTALSTHVEKIMIDNGVTVPMAVSGNGVDHWDRIQADDSYHIEARRFRFLHVSACFPRKGVDALLEAYEAAFTIDDDVSLLIKTFDNPHNNVREMLAAMKARNPRFPHVVTIFSDLPENQLKALYQQCHVLVGPSFAEGFGLPFAEAMLTGIPVITTNWGGQLDFCNEGNSWLVDYKFERARTHFGLWASAWARADVASLAEAMRQAHAASPETRSAMAARGREQLMARHQWKHVAQRLTLAATTLPNTSRRNPRIGWISTWHSKCGVATYSQHLVDAIPADVTVFSPINDTLLIGKDSSIRCWRQSKSRSDLWRVLTHPQVEELDVFVIQFNYNFYNHGDLSRFISQAKALGKVIIICLHSTVDPVAERDVANFHLAWLAPALAECDRVLVHSFDDLNRLKDLGLVENVALFPHGVLRRPDTAPPRRSDIVPTIATYGFALPHKGLPELLQAVRLLHDRGRKIRLKMVNAEYPADVSVALVNDLKAKIDQLGLASFVEMHNQFLSDKESLELLTDSDLVVFPYQNTGESASGAVRYGMAVERPVAVTPLPIFSDIEGAVFRMGGTTPANIADGIAAALDAIAGETPEAKAIAEQATRWREQHDYRIVGQRLHGIICALMSD